MGVIDAVSATAPDATAKVAARKSNLFLSEAERRHGLDGSAPAGDAGLMFTLYTRRGGPAQALVLDQGAALPADAVWLDVNQPDHAEEAQLEALLGFDVPTRDELRAIEPSSRLYRENDATYVTATLVWKSDALRPETTEVAFILKGPLLVTIRYADPRAFDAVAARARVDQAVCGSGASALVTLIEAIVDRASEVLERAGRETDALSDRVFAAPPAGKRRSSADLEDALAKLAGLQKLTAKASESLVSLGRAIGFLMLAPEIAAERGLRERLKSIGRDIQSLTDHATFVAGNINFNLEASLGLISIEQNAIIKIFSIAAVVLLPPTLVATIYGMNFKAMPELDWIFGYPFALGLMIVSAIVPYLIFKRRGWL